MSKRRIARVLDWTFLVLIAWALAAAVPASWFGLVPGQVIVTTGHDMPSVAFERRINRDVRQFYGVVIRDTGTLRIACETRSAVFTYWRQSAGGVTFPLDEWVGSDKCWPLPAGTYVMETCWTVARPFYGVVPPKTQCRTSNVFTVSEVKG